MNWDRWPATPHYRATQLVALLQAHRARRPRSRAEIVRDRLIEGVRPVRALLKALVALPWKARGASTARSHASPAWAVRTGFAGVTDGLHSAAGSRLAQGARW